MDRQKDRLEFIGPWSKAGVENSTKINLPESVVIIIVL